MSHDRIQIKLKIIILYFSGRYIELKKSLSNHGNLTIQTWITIACLGNNRTGMTSFEFSLWIRMVRLYPSFTLLLARTNSTLQKDRGAEARVVRSIRRQCWNTRGVIVATERTYYSSNTKATDHCFVIFLPSSGGERKTTPIHWNDDGDGGVRYGSLIIIEAIRPGGRPRATFFLKVTTQDWCRWSHCCELSKIKMSRGVV